MLVDCAASPFLGHRSHGRDGRPAGSRDATRTCSASSSSARAWSWSARAAGELALKAGDVVLWDGMQPTEVEIVEAFYKRTLLFPRDQVVAVCPRLAERQRAALAGRQRHAPGCSSAT